MHEKIEKEMKYKPKFLTVTFIYLILAAVNCFSADFRLSQIVDGDTLEIITEKGERITVDLIGIDAPEMPKRKSENGQPFCKQARKMLADLIVNKRFSFQAESRLINNQVYAVVYSQGKNVNLEMIKAGFAEVYKGAMPVGFDVEPYREEAAVAKKKEKGMWALGFVYMSPMEWRKANTKSP